VIASSSASAHNFNLQDPFPLKIVTYPHPTLRHVSSPIRRVDAELREIAREMLQLMYAAHGIGLAANQVDLPLKMFVMNLAGKVGEGEELVLVNPVVTRPKGSDEAEEGCLSLPGLYAQVKRPKSIHLHAYTLSGQEIDTELSGLAARCVQHEVDHLEGVLFIDRIPPLALQSLDDRLYELEADFQGQRTTGAMADDATLAANRAAWTARYC
jgi:peptide deformylase